jgi:hypothetical protein
MSDRVREFATGVGIEKPGGIGLILATAAALVCANSATESYEALRQTTFGLPSDPALTKTLERWIDDGLMALFFLLVGLEIKRELVEGELADCRRAGQPERTRGPGLHDVAVHRAARLRPRPGAGPEQGCHLVRVDARCDGRHGHDASGRDQAAVSGLAMFPIAVSHAGIGSCTIAGGT